MGKMLKIEFRKVIKSKTLWLSIVIGCVIAVMHTVWVYKKIYMVNNDIYNYYFTENNRTVVDDWFETGVLQGWLGTEGASVYNQMFYFLFPLLATMPYGLSMFREWNSGYSNQMLIRTKRKNYFMAKYIATFVSGGMVLVIPLALSLVMACCYLPIIGVDPMAMAGMSGFRMWINLYIDKPILYALGYMIINFIYGGISALFTMVISNWCTNSFLALIFPMITNIFMTMGIGNLFIDIRNYIPGNFVNPIQHMHYEFNMILTVTLILLILVTTIYYCICNKKDALE